MRHLCVQALAALQIFTMCAVTVAEPFYQHRDHRDQFKYLRHTNENIVKDKEDAERVLEKYGYLRCRVRRKKREALKQDFAKHGIFSAVNDIVPGFEFNVAEEDGLMECNEEKVSEAIKVYQKTYHLPQTGELDEPTRRFMSNSRCGNKDNEPTVKTGEGEAGEAPVAGVKLEENKSTPTPRRWRRSLRTNKLWQVLRGQASSLNRRRRQVREYVQKLQERYPKLLQPPTPEERERHRRSLHVEARLPVPEENNLVFNKRVIKWRLLHSGYSTRIPVEDQRATIELAFTMWSEVIPLNFVEDTTSDIQEVDIQIAFGRGSHQNCANDFDGNGGEVAHSWHAGNMHFDDEEDFKSINSFAPDGIYLLLVAVHEIGHVLGLSHTSKEYSVMYAIYSKNTDVKQDELELGWEDRKEVQKLYGVCKGQFNTVFDWVRKGTDSQFIYNTYFFRKNHYWMYENHANRTRYGDPLIIDREWKGVPEDVDSYLHIWFYDGKDVVDEAFFFKGENFYKYDSAADQVYAGWPRKIADEFGPKEGQTERIPDNLDATFFDMRDKNIYFFKDDWVYVFDPKLPPESRGCCERKVKIWEEFPSEESEHPLQGNVDVVYYSYKDKAMYFMKGEDLWKNVPFYPRQRQVKNSVRYVGKWYEKWFDICDVRT